MCTKIHCSLVFSSSYQGELITKRECLFPSVKLASAAEKTMKACNNSPSSVTDGLSAAENSFLNNLFLLLKFFSCAFRSSSIVMESQRRVKRLQLLQSEMNNNDNNNNNLFIMLCVITTTITC